MKNILLALLVTAASGCFAQVKITASAAANPVPQASAMLEVESATRGLLFPRITTAERNAIASPANGLSIFNTTTSCMEYYDGSIWRGLCYADGSGAVTTLDCAGGAQTGTFQANVLSAGTKAISYTGGSGSYGPISVASTGVTGLTASASAGNFSASGTITLAISGTPNSSGTASFNLTVGGQACTFTVNVASYLYGGSNTELAKNIIQTTDGGYIMVSSTNSSVSGDVTGANHGNNDWWVVKLDATGAITWQKLYGGAGNERDPKIIQVPDGNYVISGTTIDSSASGDVTGISKGSTDLWLLKIDTIGNKLWDKIYGSTSAEAVQDIQKTTDGGFVILASSFSPINTGDVMGATAGLLSENIWILKLDANGNKVWSRVYGGLDNSTDRGYEIKQTPDGGYVLTATTGVGGLLSTPSQGLFDLTIIKLDSTGAFTWHKRYGGSGTDFGTSIALTSDGGYIVGGVTDSPVSGNVTIAPKGLRDMWILKLTNTGAMSWQKRFGGVGSDQAESIKQTTDGGFIVGGATNSSVSGDVPAGFGDFDYWILKLDATGNIVWNKVYGGAAQEYLYSIMQTSNNVYIALGTSFSSQTGSVTQTNHSAARDIWVLQLNASGNIVPLTGH